VAHCAETDKEARENAAESIPWYTRRAWGLIIIPHQKVMDSIRLFGKYVIPYFK